MAQVLSLAGATVVLAAFGALQFGRLSPERPVYQLLNLAGASMLAASGLLTENWGFVLLNVVWTAFALLKLAGTRRRALT
jgi:hypothetical protein